MKLRTRLALLVGALIVPFAVLVAFWQTNMRERAFIAETAEVTRVRMLDGGREQCEADPATWHRGIPIEMVATTGIHPAHLPRHHRHPPMRDSAGTSSFAYDGTFRSLNQWAPRFDPALRSEMQEGYLEAAVVRPTSRGPEHLIAVRMPWDEGPCQYVVVERRSPFGGRPFTLALVLVPTLIVSLAAIAIAVLVSVPMVRRIRRLTDAVGASDANAKDDAPAFDTKSGDELGDLARAFAAAQARIRTQIAELEARDASLRRYVADTSHDVALPLTVLQGHLVSLQRALASGEGADSNKLAAAIEECHYLGALLQNLNVTAKLETGDRGVEMHEIDLGDIVARSAARGAPYAQSRGVELNHAIPSERVLVRADPTLVEQAISNIVQNAIRYNRAGGHVAVTLHSGENGAFRVEVIDDGPGLSEGDLERVLDRGFRGNDARTRHPTGTGLGLAIARDVAVRHGWKLDISNRVEGGLAVAIRRDA